MAVKAILGRKIGMSQIFTEEGVAVPVTVIEAGPCPVVQVKTPERDGYAAVQIGYGEIPENKVNQPLRGHFRRSGVAPQRYLREVRVEGEDLPTVGEEIKVDIFSEGDAVDVIGTSKGKGFAGVVKRYGFNRGPMSHGSMYHRRVGSLGATDPQRVFKGRRMPGRMGHERVTILNLRVMKVDPERNLLLVRGAVPGPNGSLVYVRKSVRARK